MRAVNAALVELNGISPELAAVPIATLLQRLPEVPEKLRGPIRNNGGGYVNHQFFFEGIAPGAGGAPTGALGDAISATWGSFEAFKEAFTAAVSCHRLDAGRVRHGGGVRASCTYRSPFALQAVGFFGSGWVWLVADGADGGKLKIVSSINQASLPRAW